jgi:tetratricopeptide (TPR) repeat protein
MNTQDPSLDRYRQLIDDLEQRKQPIDSQQALEILTARDALQVALEQQKPIPIDILQYKHLGWARLEQKRYPEAKEALQQAIDILGNPKYHINQRLKSPLVMRSPRRRTEISNPRKALFCNISGGFNR